VATVNLQHVTVDFYDQEVLPALFERLDRAFPEFGWTWNGRCWISAQRDLERAQGAADLLGTGELTCSSAPHFQTSSGETITWLAYLNGGFEPNDLQREQTIRMVAELAGIRLHTNQISSSSNPDDLTTELSQPTSSRAGQLSLSRMETVPRTAAELNAELNKEPPSDLREAFLGLAQAKLHGPEGAASREYLHQVWGIDQQALRQTSMGLYPAIESVRSQLIGMGFRPADVDSSYLTIDDRCEGRLIIPARDATGQLQTVFARRMQASDDGPLYLHLKGGVIPAALGLDVALSSDAAGRQNLLMVTDRLEAIAMHSVGLRRVVAMGSNSEWMTNARWRVLSQHGVRSVTLLAERESTKTENMANCIRAAAQSAETPQIWLVDPTELGLHGNWWSLLRSHGPANFDDVLVRRIHGFEFIANEIAERHTAAMIHGTVTPEILEAAAQAFAETVCPEKQSELDRYFWPVIRDCGKPEGDSVTRIKTIAAELPEHAKNLTKTAQRSILGLAQTTLPTFDRMTWGMRGLMALVGEAGTGKSTLALQFATDALRYQDDTCCLFLSLQSPREQLLTRLKSRLSGIEWRRMVCRSTMELNLTDAERSRLAQAESAIAEWGQRMTVWDHTDSSPVLEDVVQSLQQLREQTECTRSLVVVDDFEAWPTPFAAHRLNVSLDVVQQWRLEQLQKLRDAVGDNTVLFVRQQQAHTADWEYASGGVSFSSIPDSVLWLQRFSEADYLEAFEDLQVSSVHHSRWLDAMHDANISLGHLSVCKGRDGVHRGTLPVAFDQHRSRFEEGIPRLSLDTEL
jgi:hypothetical protein